MLTVNTIIVLDTILVLGCMFFAYIFHSYTILGLGAVIFLSDLIGMIHYVYIYYRKIHKKGS